MSLNHLYEDTSQGSGDGAGVSIEILGDQLDLYILGYPGRRYRKQQEKVCELIWKGICSIILYILGLDNWCRDSKRPVFGYFWWI